MTATVPTAADLDLTPAPPRAGFAATVARRLFGTAAARVGVEISHDGSPADLRILHPDRFYARLGSRGLTGFGESYVAGEWEADDLGGALTPFCRQIATLVPGWMQRCRAIYLSHRPQSERNTIAGARRNIRYHYDLSNEFFASFLDPGLTYSSALFERPGMTLREAQNAKIDRILDQARVTAGTDLLEIGTGWGELAIRAAGRGARVRSATLSSEQLELARERIEQAGLSDRIEVELTDYRQAGGRYDAVVSVEMIEAVGHQYWDEYMRTVAARLKPGGTAAIQAITMDHNRMLATRGTATWISTYIFPGGCLPSVRALDESAGRAGLDRRDLRNFGTSYAETLHRWDAAFRAASDRVSELGFDRAFQRLWHFYLEYCRAGFAAGYIDVGQITYQRTQT
ncbi:MAG: cyclopropane-fatty-acyl-phospholipid synthase family protein [Solirubrobacterales bacterium]|nr:cyclopropane-fatty-acyl-phospholipid synthase family protein [Solirubrobacterales bacterium]